MAFGFASWLVFLHLLLALYAQGDESIIRLNSMDDDDDGNLHHHHHHHHDPTSSHMHHQDPQLMVFFMLQDLKIGKVMPIYFPHRQLSSSHLLPKHEADAIPFSLKELTNLLEMFSFSQNSPQAKAMENTLKECETKPIVGETKLCATSLESMQDFTRGIFGLDVKIKTLTTTHIRKSTSSQLLQNYTIMGISQNIPSPKLVACHTMPYPYVVFYCHSQESENKVLMVSLKGENGDLVEALSVCHMDTSHWSRDHVSFGVLGVEPRTTHVCHFFPSDNFVFIPVSAAI